MCDSDIEINIVDDFASSLESFLARAFRNRTIDIVRKNKRNLEFNCNEAINTSKSNVVYSNAYTESLALQDIEKITTEKEYEFALAFFGRKSREYPKSTYYYYLNTLCDKVEKRLANSICPPIILSSKLNK